MHRIHFSPLVMLIITAIVAPASGGEPRSASQTFVVRVSPKVTFESSEVIPQSSTSTSSESGSAPSADKGTTAFRLSGTSAAGITAWIEVQSNATMEAGYHPEISLRIVEDEKNQWTVSNRTEAKEHVLQASSSGTGAATLIISTDAGLKETVIVTTIISKE